RQGLGAGTEERDRGGARLMAAPTAPVLGGSATKEVALDEAVFAADVKPHLVHEAVRAELNARRAGTAASKSRGQVSGGRSKPWRQKGTGRARAGTIRAAQFTKGGHAFAKSPRQFEQKVNRKAAKAALRSALASHAGSGTLALLDTASFDEPSTKQAKSVLEGANLAAPTLVVLNADEEKAWLSFRNLAQVTIVTPSELEVAAVVWARS